MNDVEAFAQLTKQMLVAIEGLAKAIPPWRIALDSLADLTPGAMRFHGLSGVSSGVAWDRVAADLELPRLEAARVALLAALSEPLDRLPGPS